MDETDIFYRPSKESVKAKKKEVLPKPREKPDKRIVKAEYQHFEDNVGDTITVTPSSGIEKTRVKYSVSQTVNKRFLISLEILEEMLPYVKELGCTKSEYERNILKPLRKMAEGRVRPKGQREPKINVKKEKSDVSRISSFERTRKAKESFDELYNKLKREGVDVSSIAYKNGEISLLDSAKAVRLYFNEHKLKHGEKNRYFSVDEFIEGLFGNKLNSLYEKNEVRLITQGQLQTLASWLVGDMVEQQ